MTTSPTSIQSRHLPHGISSAPAECYEACNQAFSEAQAQSTGTTELCDTNGTFLSYYRSCISCVQSGVSTSAAAGNPYWDPRFGTFLNLCHITSIAVTITVDATVNGTASPVTTITQIANVPNVIGSNSFTTSSSAATNSTLLSLVPSQTLSSPAPSTLPIAAGSRGSAWLAGPIVGSLGGLALIGIVCVKLWRRRKKAKPRHDDAGSNGTYDKPQLHSDCIPNRDPHELDAYEKQEPVELLGVQLATAEPQPLFELEGKQHTLEGHVGGRWELENPYPVTQQSTTGGRDANGANGR